MYPLWDELITQLVEAASAWLDEQEVVTLRALARQRPQAVVEIVRQQLGNARYRAVLRELLWVRTDPETGRSWTGVQELVCRCAFQAVVTTNYDPGIVDARMRVRPGASGTGFATWQDELALDRWRTGDVFAEVELPVLFAHGQHNRPDSVVLATTDYRRAYAGKLPQVLARLLDGHVCWIGFSFADQRITAILGEIGKRTGTRVAPGTAPRHVAVMPWDPAAPGNDPQILAQRAEIEYGAQLVLYPAPGGDHSALSALLAGLADPRFPAAGEVPAPPAVLRSGTGAAAGKADVPVRWVPPPDPVPHFTGRAEELDQLDRWAADPDVRLVAVSAWAGTGKTALVTHWVQKGGIARRSGLQGVFGWSFYTDPSAERWAAGFLNWARSDLGVPVPETGPVAWRVLGVLVAAPVLLVLDGLEVVQEGPAAEGFGRLLDGLLREVLTGTCQLPHAGLVLLTSRFPFADLETFDGRSARILELPGFTPAEGAALLAAEGGTWLGEDERRELAAAVDGHALAVAVLGQLLAARPPSGDLAALREELATAAGTDIRVSKLLDFYSGQLGEADRYLLAGVSLFTHPVTADAALAVAAHEAFGGQLEGWTSAMVQTAVRTRLSGLATWHRDGTLSVHSLVRDTFRPLAIPAAATAAAYGDISLTGATPHSWATMTRPSGDPVTIAAPPQPAPEPTTARRRRTYVNVGFAAAENARQVIEPDHLAPGHDVWVWVEIGPRVVGAVPGDVQPIDPAVVKDLDEVEVVLFPDAGLIVAPDPAVGRLGVTASGPFRVREPAAIPPQAGLPTARRLFFTLTTPAQPGNYRLRCAVYAKGLLLHVEQLTVVVGPSRRSISARTTFRLVRDLAAVDQSEIHEHRLSIYANAQPDGSHAFSFRGADGRSFFTRQVRLGDSDVNTTLTFARAALHHASWRSDKKYDGQSSKYDEHSRGGFAPDLAAADVIDLARSGYNLWLQFAEQLPSDEGEAAASPEPADNNLHALRDLMCKPGGAVQLAPIKGPDLIVPIQLFYDRLLDSSENAPLPDVLQWRRLDRLQCR